MHELEQSYAKWRKVLLRINMFLAVFAFFVELFMFFVLRMLNLIFQPIPEYFKWFLLIPTIVNAVIILAGELMLKYMSPDSRYIKYVPIVQMSAICTVLATIHNIFSVTLCLFCFPLFITAIFGDRKMVRVIALQNCVFLTVTLCFRRFGMYKPDNDIYFFAEAIVAYIILATTMVVSELLFKFQEEKTSIFNQGYIRQLEMQDQLNKDQKTGLYGQTIFTNTLNQMVDGSKRTNRAIQLAIIDIDDFKKINDTYGHLKGDQIILILTDLMRSVFKDNQFLSRYGGEEFTVIFSDSDLDQAFNLLEELRTDFQKKKHYFMDERVTISIGIAKWEQEWTAEQLFEAADSAMYASKKTGKNKTTIYSQELFQSLS